MSVKFYIKNLLCFIILLILNTSCKNKNSLELEIANVKTNIEVERFDLLFAGVTSEKLPELKKDYAFMFSEKYKDSFWVAKRADTIQVELFKAVNGVFDDFKNEELEIESLFNHLAYYFPEFNLPRVITTTSDVDYRNRVIVTDSIAILALDTYLGADHEFYENIPKYISDNLRKEQITVDLAEEYGRKFVYQGTKKTLLDEMIYFGKLLYFKDVVIPFKTDAERIGYSQEQLDWAIANESEVWRYFVERELLFSTDSKLVGRFINPAPFSKFYLEGVDAESPGRLGQYIGWQIIRAYMDQNTVSLKDMLIADTQEIFNNSKFKPRK